MLIIHPKDRTTAVLSILYQGLGAQLVDTDCHNKEMNHLLHHTSSQERIMLLGHGCDKGLYFRKNDEEDGFDKVIIGHPHAFRLRNHGSNLIGIWCHADMFAEAEGLHGLFSGMIISEKHEAEEYGIMASQAEISASNKNMFTKMRKLLDEGAALSELPVLMKAMDDEHTPLSEFNYGNFHYL